MLRNKENSLASLQREESGREFLLSENLMQCANGQLETEDPSASSEDFGWQAEINSGVIFSARGRVVAKAKTG